jgi:ABC-type multidrug transport system ATPase subunit
MKLLRYNLSASPEDNFIFEATNFSRINLLVGDSGTGKTKFLNTIDNFFKQLVSPKIRFSGKWDVDFEVAGISYNYRLSVTQSTRSPREKTIESEILTKGKGELFNRSNGSIIWKGNKMPKLSSDQACFSLLEDDEITPIYLNMKKVIARRFSGNELDANFQLGTVLSNAPNNPVPPHIKSLGDLAIEPIDFHNKMYILKIFSPGNYKKVIELIKTAFPIIEEADIQDMIKVLPNFQGPLHTHVFSIKEKNIEKWIATNNISSGMQKIFLLILDTILLQDAGILLIDEYENSLGISAINFLPDLIDTISENCQFIITSHHPYIINKIPIESWKVFHREGIQVHITDGDFLKEKYSKSSQDNFVQLINDPIYKNGLVV